MVVFQELGGIEGGTGREPRRARRTCAGGRCREARHRGQPRLLRLSRRPLWFPGSCSTAGLRNRVCAVKRRADAGGFRGAAKLYSSHARFQRPRDRASSSRPIVTDSYEIVPGRSDAGLLLICDHAVNALPASYGTLGLAADQLERHIAYDIGALQVTQRVAQMLGVPAISTRFSRLLIDVNRGLDDPTLIMRISDGAVVPGNRHIDAAERERRVRALLRALSPRASTA